MSFDKVKAMRNAERFLAQGKIRAAINEYKRVVEFDKTDVNTLNMLGDLYVKSSETDEAVKCFNQVAEHYSKQGFAQKAIAIYNKLSRLNPDSIDVAAKLAELYQAKGSLAEARNQYSIVAEQYSKLGKKSEALGVWKQIANLDPNNCEIYLKIADACWQNQQKDEAADAYIEAGNRLCRKSQFESAMTAFSRALEIRPDDILALRAYTKAQLETGYADEAVKSLESSASRQPNNREIAGMLADCYIEAGNLFDAERTVVKLVEQEPTQYSKLLDLFEAYIKTRDVKSAGRVLTMASEHMLVGGKAIELEKKINEILAINPDDLDAARLSVRFHSWQRDAAGMEKAFEKLAEVAKNEDAVEDEVYALSQLVLIAPQNSYFAERLQELSLSNGAGLSSEPKIADSQLSDFQEVAEDSLHDSTGETIEHSQEDQNLPGEQSEFRDLTLFERHGFQSEIEGVDFYIEQGFWDLAERTLDEIQVKFGNQPEIKHLREVVRAQTDTIKDQETEPVDQLSEESPSASSAVERTVEANEASSESSGENYESSFEVVESRLNVNSDSIPENEIGEFYSTEMKDETSVVPEGVSVESIDSPEPAVDEVESAELGKVEADKIPGEEVSTTTCAEDIEENLGDEIVETEANFDSEDETSDPEEDEPIVEQEIGQNAENVTEKTVKEEANPVQRQKVNSLEEMTAELSSPERVVEPIAEEPIDDDFETSFQTGVAYREMGLIEDAIREFQTAIKRVSANDGTRRFFLCCNMLGLCFMEKQMPTIAIKWLKQGIESKHLSEFELNGMRYELASAYEMAGDKEKAKVHFEEIYTIDVSFRDVGARLESILGESNKSSKQ